MGKCQSATTNILQVLYAALLVSTLLVFDGVEAQPTSNTDVADQLHALLAQRENAVDKEANGLLLLKLFQQRLIEAGQAEKQPQVQDGPNRLETRAAGGAKRYQGSRRIGGTIILGR